MCVKLAPQPFKVLELLARHRGQVVTRAEIRDHVWSGDTFVDFDQGLNFCIRQIREVLGDTADAPRFIETLPRRGYRFLMPVTDSSPAAAAPAMRLIVLPFRMLRPDPETDFLAFSLPDAVTGALGGLQSLVVRSSMTAARFAGDAVAPGRIAAEADVDAIVTGTLLRSGPEIRVTTQLTAATSGALLWSQAAQMPVGDLFRVQDELTRRIVASLSLPLTNREQQMLRRDVPSNPAAYEYFLRGNQLGHDPSQWSVARDLYLQSVEEDRRLRAGVGAPRPDPSRDGQVPAQGDAGELRSGGGGVPAGARAQPGSADRPQAVRAARGGSGTCPGRDGPPDRAGPHGRPGAAGRPREHLPLLRPARCLGGGARARARARAEGPHQRGPHVVPPGGLRAGRDPRDRGLPLHRGDLAQAEQGHGQDVLPVLHELEARLPGRLRDFAVVARTMLEGHAADSIAAVGRIVAADFRDPEGLFYLSRHLARLNDVGPALALLERVVASGYVCFPTMAHDPWLDSLRAKPAFATLLRRAEGLHQEALTVFERLGGPKLFGATAVPA